MNILKIFREDFELRRKIFNTILYFACKPESGKNFYKVPFEDYYIWDALARAVADYLKFELPKFNRGFGFQMKTWNLLEERIKTEAEADIFFKHIYELLKTSCSHDQTGGRGYYNDVENFYWWVGKTMNSVTSIGCALENELKFLDETDSKELEEKCMVIGKSMRLYLDRHIAEIKKTYHW